MPTIEEKGDIYNNRIDEISSIILKQMKEGASNWQMPWHRGIPEAFNLVTGKYYGGNNLLILWQKCLECNNEHNKWATFKQWRKIGSKVRAKEKGTLICIAVPNKNQVANIKIKYGQLSFEFVKRSVKDDVSSLFIFDS